MVRARQFKGLEFRISDLDKPVAISYLEGDVGKTVFQAIHPMKKTAHILNSTLALVMLAYLTSPAIAGHSITQAKINQIIPGQTTEADLVRAFGPPATKMVCPPEEMALDWFYVTPISAQNYIPVIGPALGGTQVKAWELWVVLNANGGVRRYIAYGHYVNGETRRYIERSGHRAETGKNIQVRQPTDLSQSRGWNRSSSGTRQGG